MNRFISSEEVRKTISNTYEAVMAAAREARRLNARMKMLGMDEEKLEKMTSIALQRLLDGKVYCAYKTEKAHKKT